jgi:hypothetical protein
MFRAIQILMVAIALCAASATAQAGFIPGDPLSWDLLNETFGNGTGQTSFLGWMPLNNTVSEVLHDGYATITTGDDLSHWGNASVSGMPSGNTEVTVEYKIGSSTLNHYNFTIDNGTVKPLVQTNATGNGDYAANTISDYRGSNVAPTGFDGSAVHTLRIANSTDAGGTTELFLDGNPTMLTYLSWGGGADGKNVEMNLIGVGTFDVYSVKMATGAYAPAESPEPSTFVLLVIGALSLLAYAWRKRK